MQRRNGPRRGRTWRHLNRGYRHAVNTALRVMEPDALYEGVSIPKMRYGWDKGDRFLEAGPIVV